MARILYTTRVDEDTGELIIMGQGPDGEQQVEIGRVLQDVVLTDLAGNVGRITENGSIPVSVRDTELQRGAWTALAAAGTTDAIITTGYTKHTVTLTITAIDTSVDVQVEGMIYGGTWFNLDDSNAVTQFASDGQYQFHAERVIDQIRFNFVAEAGGAAAVLTPAYAGSA